MTEALTMKISTPLLSLLQKPPQPSLAHMQVLHSWVLFRARIYLGSHCFQGAPVVAKGEEAALAFSLLRMSRVELPGSDNAAVSIVIQESGVSSGCLARGGPCWGETCIAASQCPAQGGPYLGAGTSPLGQPRALLIPTLKPDSR